jgi:SPP1 family predicted phage head-tail adaptor
MPIGAYRFVVTVQTPGPPGADGDGGYTETWQDATPPTWSVSIAPAAQGQHETKMAGTLVATGTHQVRGRYHPAVSTRARLLVGGRVFNVISVQDAEERHRALDVVCAEVVS